MKIDRKQKGENKPQYEENEEDRFENDFDKITIAKQKGSFSTKAIIFVAVVTVFLAFVFSFVIYTDAFSKIAVVDSGGRYLEHSILDREELEKTLIVQTCSNLVHNINTFDRNGYHKNYNKALAYCVTSELNKITEVYEAEKMYYDAIERGVIFSCNLNKIHEVVALDNGNINVSFNSVLVRKDGDFSEQYIIESQGTMSRTTSKYPDNTTGWAFIKYIQVIRPIQK